MRNENYYKHSRQVSVTKAHSFNKDRRVHNRNPPPQHLDKQKSTNDPNALVGLQMNQITIVNTITSLSAAMNDIHMNSIIGFDTESKPTRIKGEVSLGPHLVQLSTLDRAYLFSIPSLVSSSSKLELEVQKSLRDIFQNKDICKVGFGLASDTKEIRAKFGVEISNIVDLGWELREGEERSQVGTQRAVLRVLGRHFDKPKKVSMSNWGLPIERFTERQILYAANDAYVALLVHNEWQRKLVTRRVQK
jgi:RNA polymerase sigma factor for flagellar operon FliA